MSGVVFFSVETAECLLATHVSPPLDACTYMGLDSGARPGQVPGSGDREALAWATGPDATGLAVGPPASLFPSVCLRLWGGAGPTQPESPLTAAPTPVPAVSVF